MYVPTCRVNMLNTPPHARVPLDKTVVEEHIQVGKRFSKEKRTHVILLHMPLHVADIGKAPPWYARMALQVVHHHPASHTQWVEASGLVKVKGRLHKLGAVVCQQCMVHDWNTALDEILHTVIRG